jgi:putative solute:sodium symporter small subunit
VSSARRRLTRPPSLRHPREVAGRGLRPPREELAEATAHGEVYLRRLRRAQLSLSLMALVAFGAIFGVLPIALYLAPGLQRIELLGVPLPLWILVVPLLGVFAALGWLYTRRADALDDSFRDSVS